MRLLLQVFGLGRRSGFAGRLAGNYGRVGLEPVADGGFVMQKLC